MAQQFDSPFDGGHGVWRYAPFLAWLTSLGDQGWELVSDDRDTNPREGVVRHWCLFKRSGPLADPIAMREPTTTSQIKED
jgi:hypothetical protein